MDCYKMQFPWNSLCKLLFLFCIPYLSRIVGRSTCGWWTMPPNMEKYYDPQYDLGDAEDKESIQIVFNCMKGPYPDRTGHRVILNTS